MAAAERPALVVFAAPELGLLMKVVSGQAAALRLQPGCGDLHVSFAADSFADRAKIRKAKLGFSIGNLADSRILCFNGSGIHPKTGEPRL